MTRPPSIPDDDPRYWVHSRWLHGPKVRPGRRALATVAVIVVVFWSLDVVLAWRTYRSERAEIRQSALAQAVAAGNALEQLFAADLQALNLIATTPALIHGDPASVREYFDRSLPILGSLGGLAFVDLSGGIVVSGSIDVPDQMLTSAVANVNGAGSEASPSFLDVIEEGSPGGPILSMAAPTHDARGMYSGLVMGLTRLEDMPSRLGSVLAISDLKVVDHHGHVIFDDGAVVPTLVVAEGQALERSTGEFGLHTSSIGVLGGDDHVVAYAAVEPAGWMAFVDQSSASLYGPFRTDLQQQLTIVGLLGLVALVSAALIAQGLGRSQAAGERLLRSEYEARRRAQVLERLAAELGPLALTGDITRVVSALAREASGAMHAAIGIIDRSTGELTLVSTDHDPELQISPQYGDSVPVSARIPVTDALRTGRPIYLGRADEIEENYPGLITTAHSPRQALAALPLPSSSGGHSGVLVLSFSTAQEFGLPVRRFLEAVAAHGAVAIERAQLHELEQTMRIEAQHRQHDLDAQTRLLQLAQQAAGIGHWTRDPAKDEAQWSSEMFELLGIDHHELHFVEAFLSRVHPDDSAAVNAAQELDPDCRTTSLEFRYDHPAHGWRWIHQDSTTITADTRQLVVGLRYDVTERTARLERERHRRARAERLARVASRLTEAETSADVATVVNDDIGPAVRAHADLIVRDLDDPARLLVLAPEPGGVHPSQPLRPASPFAAAMHGRYPVLLGSPEAIAARCPDTFDELAPNTQAFGVIPIEIGGVIDGSLAVSFPDPTDFDDELVSTLRSMAALCGQALARTRRYDVERDFVVGMQRSLIPQVTHSDTAIMWASYNPAQQIAGVGGDWYDVWDVDDRRTAFIVGDVVGHGVAAAIAMSQLRSAARAIGLDDGPAALLARLDRFVGRDDDTWMATMACLVHDHVDGTLRYSLAGHPYPVARLGDGRVIQLDQATDTPLGPALGRQRPETTVQIPDGALLVAYTDGLVERRTTSIVDRMGLLNSLVASFDPSGDIDLCEHVHDGMSTASESQRDDIAVLCVRLASIEGEIIDSRRYPAVMESLAASRAMLREVLSDLAICDSDRNDLLIAFGEACTNSVEHGARDHTSTLSITTRWAESTSTLTISIRDDGLWRQVRADPSRGRGIGLMRSLTDSLEVSRSDKGTTVTLRKRVRRNGQGTS